MRGRARHLQRFEVERIWCEEQDLVVHVMEEGRVLQFVEDRARAALDAARPYRRVEWGHLVRVVAWALLPTALIQPSLDLRRRDVLVGCQNGVVQVRMMEW